MCKHILPTSKYHEKYMENNEENMHVDTGA